MSTITELKRRNVLKVAITYAVVAWLIIDISATTLPILHLPVWSVTLVTTLLLIGFLPAIIFAWAFELTANGITRDHGGEKSASNVALRGRNLDFFVIGALSLAVILLFIDRYVLVEPNTTNVSVETPDKPLSAAVTTSITAPSIAVLPFRNRSALAEDTYFVDGIHDDILTQLSKLSALGKVISRTSMEQYRDTTLPMQQIGRELAVATILEGGVQRAGDRIRINVQLIDAETDEHLWAETYERELNTSNIFGIQNEIATSIAAALQATLNADELWQLSVVPTESLAAYDVYLLGKQAMTNRTIEYLDQARLYFKQAVTLDPDFALAHVGFADSTSLFVAHGGQREETQISVLDTLSEAEAAARRALTLNARLGEAYASIGFINRARNEYVLAEANLTKALALTPGYATAFHWYALILAETDRESEALHMMQRGIALDPLSRVMHVNVSALYDALGQSDNALASLHRALRIDPQFDRAITDLGRFHFYHGNLSEAIVWYRQALDLDPSNIGAIADIAAAYRHLGAAEESEYWMSRVADSDDEFERQFASMYRLQDLGRSDEAAEKAKTILTRIPGCVVCLTIIGNHLVDAGEAKVLIEIFQKNAPNLFASDGPVVHHWQVNLVPAAAWALAKIDRADHAGRLLALGLRAATTSPRQRLSDANGNVGSSIVDVKILAILGQDKEALHALRNAVDSGWRFWHRFHLNDPSLNRLRSNSEFIALSEKIEMDLMAQHKQLNLLKRDD